MIVARSAKRSTIYSQAYTEVRPFDRPIVSLSIPEDGLGNSAKLFVQHGTDT